MKNARSFLFALICVTFLQTSPSYACTDFRLISKDGSVLISRSMEFAQDLASNIRTSNQGRTYPVSTINGKPTHTWKAKYGYVFVDGMQKGRAGSGVLTMAIPPGKHLVIVNHPSGNIYSQNVELELGKTLRIRPNICK